MKKIYQLIVFCFACLFISSAAFAENTNIPEEAIGAETNQVDETAEKIEKIHIPKIAEVAQEIKSLGSNIKPVALKKCLNILDLKDQKAVIKMFNDFLSKTRKVMKKGESSRAARFKKELSSKKAKTQFGKLSKDESENFVIIYPEKLAFKISKNDVEQFDAGAVLSAADSAFGNMTEKLLMSKFIYWPGKARGKIYIVPDKEIWDKIKTGLTKKQPVQTVVSISESREFFVLADKNTFQEADEAAAYAVAKAVLNEYSEVISGKRESKFPQFFVVGVAANAAELNSVLSDVDGPQQLGKFERNIVTPKYLRAVKEKRPDLFPLPLYRKNLIDIEKIVGGPYPARTTRDEPGYYYLRQSKATIDYLQQNGSLPFLILTKELADDKGFKKSFDEYVDLRDELLGKTKESKKRKKDKKSKKEQKEEKERKEAAEVCLDGYKEFIDNAEEVVFEPLTYEFIMKDKMEEAKEKKKSRKKRSGRKRR